jgi:hypothetical protein
VIWKLVALLLHGLSGRRPGHGERQRDRRVGDAAGRFLYYVVIPMWGVPGLVDWWHHRKTHIEEPANGSVRESVIHSLMLAEGGAPLALLLFAEINPLVLAAAAAAASVHELTARWDLEVAANSDREVTPAEQQIHSALETLPFFMVVLAALHAWPEMRGHWTQPSAWRIRPKERLPSLPYIAAVGLLGAVTAVLPYGEELRRCIRAQRSGRPGPDRQAEPV